MSAATTLAPSRSLLGDGAADALAGPGDDGHRVLQFHPLISL
jgi:hypothetical protein